MPKEVNHISKNQVKMVRSLQQKKFRDELGLFVAEGEKCVSELIKSFKLELLITPDKATDVEISQMSSLRTPQGVIGVFKQREEDATFSSFNALVVALDGVQDPGNLGTIIRTCDWFGIRDIYCSRDTADCYNPKVVQATMGALARVHVHYVDLEKIIAVAKDWNIPIYGTLLNGVNLYQTKIDKTRGIIVMGNEGNGISEPIRKLVTHPLRIPSFPENAETSESLNVSIATAITLAEFRRK